MPPVIVAPPVRAIDDPANGPGEVVVYSVTVTDDHDPAPSVFLSWPSGSLFPQGTTLVTCIATDAAGNEATTQFPVKVAPKSRAKKL